MHSRAFASDTGSVGIAVEPPAPGVAVGLAGLVSPVPSAGLAPTPVPRTSPGGGGRPASSAGPMGGWDI